MGSKGESSSVALEHLLMKAGLTPVHWLSHGSTMMLGEESESATYWKKAGDEALANGIKGVIMMVRSTDSNHPQSRIDGDQGSTLGRIEREDRRRHESKSRKVTRR